jgi:hypothetical protein
VEGDGSSNELRRGGRGCTAPRQHGSSFPAHWRHRRRAEGSARGVFAHRGQTLPRLFLAESSGEEAEAVRHRGSTTASIWLTGIIDTEVKAVRYVCPSRTSTPLLFLATSARHTGRQRFRRCSLRGNATFKIPWQDTTYFRDLHCACVSKYLHVLSFVSGGCLTPTYLKFLADVRK